MILVATQMQRERERVGGYWNKRYCPNPIEMMRDDESGLAGLYYTFEYILQYIHI